MQTAMNKQILFPPANNNNNKKDKKKPKQTGRGGGGICESVCVKSQLTRILAGPAMKAADWTSALIGNRYSDPVS